MSRVEKSNQRWKIFLSEMWNFLCVETNGGDDH